jgi:ribonuclease BN (tRNA processing enzyme)
MIGSAEERAKVILLGSGTPVPDPAASGPAVAIVVNGRAYLFDAGAGVVRRAEAAAEKFHMQALEAPNLSRLFITHLHSDHTLGYPDVILTPWVMGRMQPLDVYGPIGTAAMTGSLKQAYSADIKIRSEGLESLAPGGLEVNVHEIHQAGPVYHDQNIDVRAIAVRHGSWSQAFGYAIDAGGRKIVISGDTAPTDAIADACQGCDVLLHEVYSGKRGGRSYHAAFHTSTEELAELASKCKPKLLVLYHQLYFGSQRDLEKEIRHIYPGNVVNGRDLTAY